MSILIFAVVGAVSGLIGYLFSKLLKLDSKTENTVSTIFVGISIVASNTLILPAYREWKNIKVLEQIPVYQVIKNIDPPEYEIIRTEYIKGLKENKSSKYLSGKIRPVIQRLVKKYSPYASDAALIDYWGITLQEIKEVGKTSSDECYKMLFPEIYGNASMDESITEKMKEKDLDALAKILESAKFKHAQKISDQKEIEDNSVKIIKDLLPKYGNDLSIIQDLNAQNVDKKKGCEISTAFMESVLKLPSSDAAGMIRNLLSTEDEAQK